jgi:phage terminase large subunit-like protein
MKDEIVWADSPDDLVKYVDGDPDSVMSMTFIPALVHDNRKLLDADPSYLANLKSLPAIEQARYLGGNWNAKESAGDYFQKSVFRIWGATELQRALNQQDGKAAEIVQKCRIWDFAATPVTGNLVPGIQRSGEFKARDPRLDDPDWTVSVLLGRTRNGRIIILDTTFHRDTPGAVQALVERMAIQDGPTTTVGIFSEPAQAGVDQSERVRARVKAHAPCDIIATANKEYVAREAARAVWRGEIFYLESAVNDRFWNQLHDFPTPKKKDDAVVAFAFAYQWMQQHPAPFYLAPKVEELWVPPNVDKLAMYPPRERARRGAVIVPIGGTRGFARRNW